MITWDDLKVLEEAPDEVIQAVLDKEGITREQFDEDVAAARVQIIFGGLAARVEAKMWATRGMEEK